MWQLLAYFVSSVVFWSLMCYLVYSTKPKPMRTLLIDDLRNIKADRIARTFDDGIYALLNDGPWEILYLDHDLASYDNAGKEKTGYDIVCFLEANPELMPGKIILVTSNPVGRKKMQSVIDKMYGRNT